MTRRAGSYGRLSVYRDGSKSESPERQHKDNKALGTQKGLEVIKQYTDKDTSAFHDVKRPQFEQALQDLRDGEIQDLIAWDISRLTRKGLQGVVEILEALKESGGKLHLVHGGVDTSTPLGEAILGLLASVAAEESRSISRRVSSFHLAAAEQGLPHSGGSRGFGYTKAMEQIPEEVELIREMASRILAGESRNAIAKDLNARGYTTSTGREWTQSSVDMLLKQPRLYGMRQHKGKLFEGTWDPIFTPEEFAEIQAALRSTMQQRRQQVEEHPPLLAKLVKCGICGFTMSVTQTRVVKDRKHYRRYSCAGTNGQCGKTAILTDKADAEVVEALGRLRLPVAKKTNGNGHEVEEAQARLSAWDQQFLDQKLDPATWSAHRPKLVTELEAAEAASKTRKTAKGALTALQGGPEWWENASPAEKRRAVEGAVRSINCAPFVSHSQDRLELSFNWQALMEAAGMKDTSSINEKKLDRAYRLAVEGNDQARNLVRQVTNLIVHPQE